MNTATIHVCINLVCYRLLTSRSHCCSRHRGMPSLATMLFYVSPSSLACSKPLYPFHRLICYLISRLLLTHTELRAAYLNAAIDFNHVNLTSSSSFPLMPHISIASRASTRPCPIFHTHIHPSHLESRHPPDPQYTPIINGRKRQHTPLLTSPSASRQANSHHRQLP